MRVREEYRRKLFSLEEAVSQISSNSTVVSAMAASEPPGILNSLGKRTNVSNIRIISCLFMRDYPFLQEAAKDRFMVESWFYGGFERKSHQFGQVSLIPNNLHEAGVKKAEKDSIQVFVGTACPMDSHGYFSLSLGVTYEKVMINEADLVILEINEKLPRTLGDTMVHISEVDILVENPVPLVELPVTTPSPEESTIGGIIADMVEDGATIQLGIGGIPNAIATSLGDKKDLGIHTEMFTDGMVDLFQAGVITGRCKSLWPGKMVGTFALGSKKLYDFIHNNLVVEFQQGKITNDPWVIGQNHQMVSINTALQVDLTGQVVAEWLNGKQFSGTGGQVDTHRGAQRSPGGKGIIALRSTAKKGTLSTIVPQLPVGAMVTLGRQEVDHVVTEYGVASLKGMCVAERVKRLIGIAHPDFRDELAKQAKKADLI